MANRNLWVRPFDREREFRVRRKITLGDKTFSPGDVFDKSLVTTRRLRQLFDERVLLFNDDAIDHYKVSTLTSLRHGTRKKDNKSILEKTPKLSKDVVDKSAKPLTQEILESKNSNELRIMADERGILVDGRWGKSRLIEEILKVE
jgi:hypothetical protein